MLDLTICISFYERDINYIEMLANYCAMKYKVLLWDDRADKSVELKFNRGVRVLNSDSTKKAYIFQARMNLAKEVDTEFLWFVDSDDFPLIENIKEEHCKCDINTFSFRWYTSENSYFGIEHFGDEEYENYEGNPLEIPECGAVWNRIFRTSKVKEAIELLPKDVALSCDDDHLINIAMRLVSKSFSKYNDIIYEFYAYKSHSCRENYTNNSDQLSSVIKGLGDSIKIKENIFKNNNLDYQSYLDKFESTKFYINNASTSAVKSERYQMYRDIAAELGKELLAEFVEKEFFNLDWEFIDALGLESPALTVKVPYMDEGVEKYTIQKCRRVGPQEFEWEMVDE